MAPWASPIAFAGDGATAAGVLASLSNFRALLVIAPGPSAPARRTPGRQAFLTVQPPTPWDGALNAAAARVESSLGRPLFPLALEALDFGPLISAAGAGPPPGDDGAGASLAPALLRPWAVYELSSGRVLLDARVHAALLSTDGPAGAAAAAAVALWETITLAAAQASPPSLGAALAALGAGAAGAAAVAALAPPLWFCLACPIVLGLLAPLAINFAIGDAAAAACDALKLSPEDCLDLWVSAIGLAMVLSLLSAIPIFKVCRLMECSHRSPSPSFRQAALV